MCFVDLEKAYDCVPRGILWGVLREYGVPGPLVRAIRGHVAQCVALLPHSKKVVASSPARGLFPDLSVWSLHVLPVFTRVPPIEPHKNKNMQKEQTLISPVPDQDTTGHLDLVPRRRIAGCPLLPAVPGGGCQDGKRQRRPSTDFT